MLDLLTNIDRRRQQIEKWLPSAPIEPDQAGRQPKTLEAFTLATFPGYHVNWHHRVLCEYLDRFLSGDIRRLMVFMPPRHGKSELVSRRLPAYALGMNPDTHIISCSYGSTLAARLNRDVQRIIDSKDYPRLFPGTRLSSDNVRTASQGAYLRNSDIFEIVGHAGHYVSAGIGGAITGLGFDVGIIDDPIKNQKEADSHTYRDMIWEWYGSTFYTRAEKDARILLTLTRWHEDDLAGRLLNQTDGDEWAVLSFPALNDGATLHPHDQRGLGEALWPEKYSARILDKIKGVLGSYKFNALYQQNPRAREGNIFKMQKIEIVDALPANLRGQVRRWDLAATKKTSSDYTAGGLMARDMRGLWYIVHMRRGRLSSGEVEDLITQTAAVDGKATMVLIEQEPGASGRMTVDHYIRLLAGYNVHADTLRGDKVFRAQAFAAQVEAGNVRMLRGDWNSELLDELAGFPTGAHDDQVDALTGAFNQIANVDEPRSFAMSYR